MTVRISGKESPGGYRPVIDGLRHRTYEAEEPPKGTVVETLCGIDYKVGSRKRAIAVYDCSACDTVRRERTDGPPR